MLKPSQEIKEREFWIYFFDVKLDWGGRSWEKSQEKNRDYLRLTVMLLAGKTPKTGHQDTHCTIGRFYRRRFNLLLLRPRKRRPVSPRCSSSWKTYVGHLKLIKSNLHVKCDFFWVLIWSLFLKFGYPTRVITLIDPILPSEGLYLKNLVPISERQGPVMGGFEH